MKRPSTWTHRLAVTTTGATLLLIVAGGLVTNTGAALTVPDWPTTFGYNMFLYPWSRMIGGIFLEHSHRLLGAVVGLLTVSLGIAVWMSKRCGNLRVLAGVAVALVCLQGVLGGLRVVLVRDSLAIVHGCLAQAFFALTVVLTVLTATGWTTASVEPLPARDARVLVWLSVAVALVLYAQMVLGALTTHVGWVLEHLGGAVVVVGGVAVLVARVLACHLEERTLAWRARAIGLLLSVQVALGLGAYVVRFTGLAVPGGEAAAVGFPVAHRVVGALLLATTLTLTLHAWRRWPAGEAPGEVDVVAGRERVPA